MYSSSQGWDSRRTHPSRSSGGEDMTILPRASAGVRYVLLRRFVHPASLGSVVDREQGAAAIVAARSIFRIRPGGSASAPGRDAPDREPLIVSLCHRRAPPFLDRTGRRRATRRRVDPNVAPTVQVGGSSSGTRRSGMSNHTRVDPSASTPQRSLRAPRCRGGRRHAIRPHRMGLVRAPPLPTGRGASVGRMSSGLRGYDGDEPPSDARRS